MQVVSFSDPNQRTADKSFKKGGVEITPFVGLNVR